MDQKTGILFIAHGSPREKSNEEFILLAKKFESHINDQLVQPAFLECASPNISDGFDLLKEKKIKKIIILPYFLGNGKHTTIDIPKIIEAKSKEFPDIELSFQKPIGDHPMMIDYLSKVIKLNS
jgi:sirohydrochlorin ferrochelatase